MQCGRIYNCGEIREYVCNDNIDIFGEEKTIEVHTAGSPLGDILGIILNACCKLPVVLTCCILFFFKKIKKFLVLDKNISVIKPKEGVIEKPALDLTLRLCYCCKGYCPFIEEHFIFLYFTRLATSFFLNLAAFIIINVDIPFPLPSWVYIACGAVSYIFVASWLSTCVLDFCCGIRCCCKRKECDCYRTVNVFQTHFAALKLLSLALSVSLLLQAIRYMVTRNSTLALVLLLLTIWDIIMIVVTIAAMCYRRKIIFNTFRRRKNKITPVRSV